MREEVLTFFLLHFVACRCYGVWRRDYKSVSWGEWGRSGRMRRVAAAFVEGGTFVKVLRTRRLLRFAVFSDIECRRVIIRVSGGVNDDVAIE